MMTRARFVELDLPHDSGGSLLLDIYGLCRHCGKWRARLYFDEEGGEPQVLGDGLCSHALLEMNALDNRVLSYYITGRQGRVKE